MTGDLQRTKNRSQRQLTGASRGNLGLYNRLFGIGLRGLAAWIVAGAFSGSRGSWRGLARSSGTEPQPLEGLGIEFATRGQRVCLLVRLHGLDGGCVQLPRRIALIVAFPSESRLDFLDAVGRWSLLAAGPAARNRPLLCGGLRRLARFGLRGRSAVRGFRRLRFALQKREDNRHCRAHLKMRPYRCVGRLGKKERSGGKGHRSRPKYQPTREDHSNSGTTPARKTVRKRLLPARRRTRNITFCPGFSPAIKRL